MLNCLNQTYEHYQRIWNLRDTRLNHMLFMDSPLPMLMLVSAYLFFVRTGKKWMEHRQPMKIDRIVIAYNFIQILANFAIFLLITYYIFSLHPNFSFRCESTNYSSDFLGMYVTYVGYCCFILKLLDYLDTVFFILRKKWGQVSFLHVYHHVVISIIGYITILFATGGQMTLFVYINSVVHVVMYTYYLLSIYDPVKIKSSIAIKKNITRLQIIQFFILVVHFGHGFVIPGHDCGYPKTLSFLGLTQALFMIVLFTKFYRKAYGQKKITQKIK